MTEAVYELDDRSLAEIHGGQIETSDYEAALSESLAISGRSLQRHAGILATKGGLVVEKIERHGVRSPVSPNLPVVLKRLRAALEEKAPEIALVELLTVYEPMLEDALEHYRPGSRGGR